MHNRDVSKIFINAFDTDIQRYTKTLLKELGNTSVGTQFIDWARENPNSFQLFIRTISSVIQEIPLKNNLLIDKISDYLSRLPFEIIQITEDTKIQTKVCKMDVNKDYNDKYTKAVEDLSYEELRQVANLDKAKLEKWIDAPSKIRPFLLEKWNATEDQKEKIKTKLIDNVKNMHTVAKGSIENTRNALNETTEGLNKFNNQLENYLNKIKRK